MTHKEFLKHVGMELKVSRSRMGLSSVELSKVIAICSQSILRIESGKSDVRILTIKRIADALGVSLKDIL